MKKLQSIAKPERKEAVVYARVSSKEQETEGFSIPAQLELLRQYARKMGYTIIKEYVESESAKSSGREQYGEMVKYLAKVKRPIVFVEKTDRLYRNLKDYLSLDELSVEIHMVKEGQIISHDSHSSVKLMHGIKVLLAKNYIDNLREEVKKGMKQKAIEGGFPQRAPIGYVNVQSRGGKKEIAIDPHTSKIVIKAYELYATGTYSIESLTQYLNANGYRYETGNTLKRETVYNMLKNPIYIGEIHWQGETYAGHHETFITRELYQRVQDVRTGKTSSGSRDKHAAIFQGIIDCGVCGCRMSPQVKAQKYTYYTCTGFKGKHEGGYVREELIDSEYVRNIRRLVLTIPQREVLKNTLRETLAGEQKENEEQARVISADLTRAKSRLSKLLDVYLDGSIDKATYDAKSDELRTEVSELEVRSKACTSAHLSYIDDAIRLFGIVQDAVSAYESANFDEKRKFLNFVVQKSTWMDGRLTVEFRKPFNFLAATVASDGTEQSGGSQNSSGHVIPLSGLNEFRNYCQQNAEEMDAMLTWLGEYRRAA